MADARTRQWTLRFEYQLDRLLAEKLAQAYELLAPDEARRVGGTPSDQPQPKRDQENVNDEAGRYLRVRVF